MKEELVILETLQLNNVTVSQICYFLRVVFHLVKRLVAMLL